MISVVLVEDEPLLLEELVKTFSWEAAGCIISGTAKDGAEAKELIQRIKPDLLITDIQLPDYNGMDLIEELDLKASIVITGHNIIQYAQRAIRLGAVDFLLKPVNDDELRRALQRATLQIRNFFATPHEEQNKDKTLNLDKTDGNRYMNAFVRETLIFIQKNYQRDIGLLEASLNVKLSEGHLSLLFKSDTGQTFIQALTNYRLNMAHKLLCDPRKQITEIASECGFHDPAYFSRVFKKNYGINPSRFRENLQLPFSG